MKNSQRIVFFRRTRENPSGVMVAVLRLDDGVPVIEDTRTGKFHRGCCQYAPAEYRGVTPNDGEAYLQALCIRYSGGYFWGVLVSDQPEVNNAE